LVSVPSEEIWSVPSVRMPSTSMAKRRMADQGRDAGDAGGMREIVLVIVLAIES
jgi:hypothetical protein